MKNHWKTSLVAGLAAVNLSAQDITLHIHDWFPQSGYPGQYALLHWDGPCGTYNVLTNSGFDIALTNWGVYETVLKHDWINSTLMSTFTIGTNTTNVNIERMFFGLEFVADTNQTGCPNSPLLIVEDPEDATVYTNWPALLNSYVIGPENRTYQWFFQGTNVVGTNMTYFIDHVVPGDAGDYFVIATTLGSPNWYATSAVATLTVIEEAQSPPPPSTNYPSWGEGERSMLMDVFDDPWAEINPIIHMLLKSMEK